MNSKRFIIADVFTDRRFGGNQLAVFTEAEGLDSATMQDIAREMNYSETTFLLPPESGGDYRVRIFTPARELPFAGHPIVGSAYVIVAERMKQWSEPVTSVTLETGVGPILVETQIKDGAAGHTTMTQPLPVVKHANIDATRMAHALSVDPAHIAATGLPIEALHNGITVIIVPIVSQAALESIKLNTSEVESIIAAYDAETILIFTRETVSASSTVHCRVFAPGAGVMEDPATGSANGPLGFYLVRHGVVSVEAVTRIVSEQGYEMKRPSLLRIEVDANPASRQVAGVRVGGTVVIAGRGEIYVS
jgi:trans-2,3-dihydro-3-hydroxyanthranilate isomerase